MNTLTGCEAIYGFAAWLTCRKERTVLSSTDNAAPVCELIEQFCAENKLGAPRDGWENNLIHPSGECSGPTGNSASREVKCVDREGFEDQLTVGFIYPIVFEGENGPQIINDKGELRHYGEGKFKPV